MLQVTHLKQSAWKVAPPSCSGDTTRCPGTNGKWHELHGGYVCAAFVEEGGGASDDAEEDEEEEECSSEESACASAAEMTGSAGSESVWSGGMESLLESARTWRPRVVAVGG